MSLKVKVIDTDPLQVVSLSEAKQFLGVDYTDFDQLIQFLIDASVKRSQAVSGHYYYPVIVQVEGNKLHEYVFPIQPQQTDPIGDLDDYTYEAGFDSGEFPEDLKQAVLQRVATGFAQRENGFDYAVNAATEPSFMIEKSYRNDLYL